MTQISRRKFIQLAVVGGAVAAAGLDAGCKNERVYKAEVTGQYGGMGNRTYPYLNQPDGLEDGVPQYFATTCQMCPAGCGLFVRTMGGRAVKVEGNPSHPVSHGKTCARAQAALQRLYNPDRIRFPQMRPAKGQPAAQSDWETALKRAADALNSARGRSAILIDGMTIPHSPTLMRLIREFAASAGATIFSYTLIDDSPWRAATRAVYGKDQLPDYRLDEADFIVAFNANFLEAWPSPVHANWLFGQFRQGPRRRQGDHGRFVYVGPRMSMTAAKADQWLPCNPGTEAAVALGVLDLLGGPGMPLAQAASISGLSPAQIQGLAQGFRAAGKRALAVAGDGLCGQGDAAAAFTAVESLNAHVESSCIGFGASAIPTAAAGSMAVTDSSFVQSYFLGKSMAVKGLEALVIVGEPNPVFTLPESAGFAQALAKVPFIAAITSFNDETSALADVLLPTRTFLEDWGDNTPAVLPSGAKIASLQQPIIDPVYITTISASLGQGRATPWMDTRPTGDLLIDLARRIGKPLAETDMQSAVRKTWAALGQATPGISTDNDRPWVSALSIGGYWPTAPGAPARVATPAPVRYAGPNGAPPDGAFLLQLYPHLFWTDGRHANLPWLQEVPDPMTSAVWNNWAEINLQVAEKMEIRTGDIVRITTDRGAIEAPALPTPGLHPGVIAMPIGQGHTNYGRYASGVGVNPFAILDLATDMNRATSTDAFAYSSTHVRLQKVRSAEAGYHPDLNTLVLLQDRPGGHEPEAVQGLIHETAREWRQAHPASGQPANAGSIFNRRINPRTTPSD
ncbi:MAG TPA: molybdopterin-dependent oxidoreductase [Capsulimonadaceae bacterium]|nr:molybdopterin-dependent oxidoreductase [Capsulimonadaceae bacterium]